MSVVRKVIFCSFTRTGTVIYFAMVNGHANWLHLRYGFGVITVRDDLLTRTPLRFALKKPYFPRDPFRREIIVSYFSIPNVSRIFGFCLFDMREFIQ